MQEKKTFKCSICDKIFSDKSDSMKHVKEHTLEKPFPCGNCVKTVLDEHMLIEHLITHTGENTH